MLLDFVLKASLTVKSIQKSIDWYYDWQPGGGNNCMRREKDRILSVQGPHTLNKTSHETRN